jgi:hypothetical protein
MAENKKSFVLYCDLIKSIEHLTNEEKGILFNHLLEYVNDKNPVLEDRLVLTAWKPIELQLKRDLIKFEEVKSKRSDAGKRSAELRMLKNDKQNSTNSTNVHFVQQTSTNSTVNVNDNVNVNVTTIEVIAFDDAINICLFDEQWKEDVERLFKIDRNKVQYALQEFKLHCGTTGENKPKSLNQFKKHFTNWVRVKKQYQVKTENKDRL